jgi:copper homeostasis protein
MTENKILLEVCADSVESACAAQAGGAFRVELCNDLMEGGITPSFAQIHATRKLLEIKLYVIIRPRGGDFLYSDVEFDIMKEDIKLCGESGCDGVVIGMLDSDGNIDKQRCTDLVQIARHYSMGVTFHRAFDRSCNLFKALEDIIDVGCERILTSGGRNSAFEGKEVIRELVDRALGRICIMPGSGIRVENIAEIIKTTRVREFHGTFQNSFESKMYYFNPDLDSREAENKIMLTDTHIVKEVIRIANTV